MTSTGRVLAWAGIAVLSTYCLFFAGAWQATYYADLRIWALIPAFAGVAAWIMVAIRYPAWRPRTALGPAFAAAFVVFVLSTLMSRSPRLSAEYLALAVLLTALYLILQRLMASSFFRPRMIGFATVAGILVGVAFLAVTVPHWFEWWGSIGHITAPPLRPAFESLTFGNPSAVMTVSVLLAAPAVAHLWDRRAGMAVSLGIVALAAVVTVISGSRSGWLAIAIAGLVVGGLWLAVPEHRSGLVTLMRSRVMRIAAIPVLAVLAAAAVVVGPGLLLRATSGGEGVRTAFYSTSVRMFQASPLVGTGPGTWAPQRITYTAPGETDYYIPHAHNIYLQTLSEFGVVGLVTGAVVVVLLGRLLLGAIRSPDPARQRMGWAALFATVYFGAHQLLDFYANAPSVLFAFAIPIAWLDATAPRPAKPDWFARLWTKARIPARFGMVAGVAGIVAVGGAAAFLAWSESGAALMRDGTNLLNDREPLKAVKPLEAAVAGDSAMPPYHLALGLALADTGDLRGAEREFSAAASMDGLPQAWLDLAAVQARLDEADSARQSLDQALRLGDQQAGVAIGAGQVALEIGDLDLARASFARALVIIPRLAGDPWWTADASRAAIWPDVYRMAFEQVSAPTQFQLALEAGDTGAAAEAILAIDDPELAATSEIVLAVWNGVDGSLDQLEARARQRPLDTTVVNWCANLLRRAGDREKAATYSAWAETINGNASIAGYEVRVVTERKQHIVAGMSTLFYGHYTYRRPVPMVQLVSWLPELGYE
jgi:O-antigen ligase/tetratricopeptide (TPR) repeat protein